MAIRWGSASITAGIVATLSGFAPVAVAAALPVYTGKVVMEDGSAPGRPVAIERTCGEKPEHLADTNAKGEYSWHARSSQMNVQLSSLTGSNAAASMMFNVGPNQMCVIRASIPGYESNLIQVEDVTMLESPLLPTLTLVRRGSGVNFESLSASVPRAASGPWNRAEKEIRRRNWNQAEQELRAVTTTAPKFAPGWATLGDVQQLMQKRSEARESYQTAVTNDPHLVSVLLMLSRMQVEASDWPAAAKTAAALAKEDVKKKYPEAYIFQALASFHLDNLDQAAAFAEEAIRVDKRHDVPLTEYVLGLILEAKKDLPGAKEHLAKFIEIDPRAPEVPVATAHMGNLGATQAVTLDIGAALDGAAAGMKLEKTAEAWVPGGIAAMAKMAGLSGTITSQNFFTEFCRALAGEGSIETAQGIPLYKNAVREYMSTIAALTQLGDHRDNLTIVKLALGTPEEIDRTTRALQMLGWRVSKSGGGFRVEPGSQPSDSNRLEVLNALGVDAVAMQEALESGKQFSFEVPSEQARLFGGNSWIDLLVNPGIPGGISAAFTLDIRLAQTYAALASMQSDAAADLVSGVGLRNIVTRNAAAVLHSAGTFEVMDKGVAVPGGKDAEMAWRELVGANPKEPPSFFRTVLEKDLGTLANFYALMARTDAAHQKFFLAHAGKFYAWYRDSREYREGIAQPPPGWRARLFRDLPLDSAGNVHFPGGRSAWTESPMQSADSLLTVAALEALVPVANLEAKRKAPLDEASAKLLGQHYSEWRGLFPIFEKLPALSGDDFTALEHFSDGVRSLSRPQQNVVMAEWHALVELMMLGMDAGAPVPPAAFRSICAGLSGPDTSKHAIALLHEMAGAGDLDQVVPSQFLRLSSDRMAGFEHVMALQHVPRLSTAKNEPEMAAALSGIVYAASLDSKGLLVNEDSRLLAKHRFTEPNLFAPPQLVKANHGPGSYFAGGLMNLRAVGKGLTPGGRAVADVSSDASAPLGTATAPGTAGTATPAETSPSEVIFRADGRLVEVFATVTDSSGHYVDDLTQDRFTILDRGKESKVVEFESRSSEVSVALLLDTTGSMHDALPALKSAALKLIDELRPSDSVAVYSFNSSVQELQGFTTEKASAKRAVLGTRPFGETALYDALTRVGRDLTGRAGKKVIVLFTDGDDNSSSLTTDIAVRRAKAAGIPVYTIAQGVALTNTMFVQQLATISKATGAESFVIHQPQEIKAVFEKVSEALSHGYLLIFQPDGGEDATWRPLDVGIKGVKGGKVRAREGYYP